MILNQIILNQNLNTRLGRSLSRRLNGRATTWLGAGRRPRPPDFIAIALRAWRRVIRARRQLMKLAPEVYDVGVVTRLARERAESDELQAELRATIARVYGVPESDLPAPPNAAGPHRAPRTQRAIADAEAERATGLAVGKEAFDQFELLRPHALPSLSQIAALLDVSSQLGRLATGLETYDQPPDDAPSSPSKFREDLKRAYGNRESTSGSPESVPGKTDPSEK